MRSIDEKEYNKQIKKLGKLNFGVIKNEVLEIDKFCNNDSCEVPSFTDADNDDQEYFETKGFTYTIKTCLIKMCHSQVNKQGDDYE